MATQGFDRDELMELMNRFIGLANEMKDEGHAVELVNASLMAASGTYSTYIAAGNDGYLESSGINKVTQTYKNVLAQVQTWKRGAVVQEDGQRRRATRQKRMNR